MESMTDDIKQAIHRALRDPEQGETLLKLARDNVRLLDEKPEDLPRVPINRHFKDPLFYSREIYKQQLAFIEEQQKEIIDQYLD